MPSDSSRLASFARLGQGCLRASQSSVRGEGRPQQEGTWHGSNAGRQHRLERRCGRHPPARCAASPAHYHSHTGAQDHVFLQTRRNNSCHHRKMLYGWLLNYYLNMVNQLKRHLGRNSIKTSSVAFMVPWPIYLPQIWLPAIGHLWKTFAKCKLALDSEM
jgi:hypothetical protein